MQNKIHPAYIAGVADSDGSFSVSIRHRNRPNPTFCSMFQLTWTKNNLSLHFMKYLVEKYGGSFYESKNTKNRFKNSKPTIKYCLMGKKLKILILEIIPYLQLKYEQANNLLLLIDSTEFGKYGLGRPKPEKLKKYHKDLYIYNKELNSKNSGNRRKDDNI